MSPTTGAVVIPAHDEEAVIGATLAPLTELARAGVEVVVATNGCTDRTAAVAAAVPGIRVIEVATASKVAALNAADDAVTGWPRLYLDADIVITASAVRAVFARLAAGDVLAARPAFFYDTDGCDGWVRAYYRARTRIPGMHEHLWGAGAYALNERGHARLGRFPDAVADDLYVDELFTRAEVAIVATTPVAVRCPRTWRVLLRTLTRVQRGRAEIARDQSIASVGGLRPVLRTVTGPVSAIDAAAYAVLAALARRAAQRDRAGAAVWQRDDTRRVGDPESVSR